MNVPLFDNPESPNGLDESERLEAFIDSLRRNPDAPVPDGLDVEFAEFIRFVMATDGNVGLSEVTRAGMWRQIRGAVKDRPIAQSANGKDRHSMQATLPVYETPARRTFKLGIVTIAAVLSVVLLLVVLLGVRRPTNIASAITPTAVAQPAHYVNLQPSPEVVWSATGQRVAAVEGAKQDQIGLWARDGQKVKTLIGHSGLITQLAWSPDGQTLASSGVDKSVRLWSAAGDPIAILSDHTDRVDSISWSPDGKTLASASTDKTIRLWTATGEPIRTFQVALGESVSFIRYGSGPDMTIIRWSPDGNFIAARYAGSDMEVWSVDGHIRTTIKVEAYNISPFAWSPDSAHIATATIRSGIQIFDLDGKQVRNLNSQPVNLVRWSPDGKLVVGADYSGLLYFWDVQSGQLIANPSVSLSISDLVISPDSSVVAISMPANGVQLFNARGQFLGKYPSISDNNVSLAWSPDSKALAVWAMDASLSIWDMDSNVLALAENATSQPTNANAANTGNANSTPAPAGVAVTPTDLPDLPLHVGQTDYGVLQEGQTFQWYVAPFDGPGKLLVFLQSDDFAIANGLQVICENGGGGGGGGGSLKGGNPNIRTTLIDTCKGQVRIGVTSITGTEHGTFMIASYLAKAEPITLGKAVSSEVTADTPFHYYTFDSEAGDQVMTNFTVENQAKLRLVSTLELSGQITEPDPTFVGANTFLGRSTGNLGMLVVPAVRGGVGKFSLEISQKTATPLDAKPQTVQLSMDKSKMTFRFKGGDQPLLLKAKILDGRWDVELTIMLLSNTKVGEATLPPLAVLTLNRSTDLSYKLNSQPGQEIILFVDANPTSSPDGPTSVQLAIETTP